MTINTAANLRSRQRQRGLIRFLRTPAQVSAAAPLEPFPLALERRLAVSGAMGLGVDPWH